MNLRTVARELRLCQNECKTTCECATDRSRTQCPHLTATERSQAPAHWTDRCVDDNLLTVSCLAASEAERSLVGDFGRDLRKLFHLEGHALVRDRLHESVPQRRLRVLHSPHTGQLRPKNPKRKLKKLRYVNVVAP